jgi:N-acetylneuraminic acid mutarotase
MNVARDGQTVTLLANGAVLAAGGMNFTSGFLASSEVYNPATGKWTLEGNLSIARFDHGAVLLNNGKVLVAGGLDPNACCGAPPLSSAELFDPATGQWTLTGSMNDARENFILIALQNGKVLAAGGNSYPGLSSAELYDPGSGTWSLTGSVDATPVGSAAVLLTNSQVFAVGNHELYNPTMGTWSTTTAPLPSNQGTVNFYTRLLNGQVWDGTNDELFDPSSAAWTAFGAPSCDAGNEHCGGGGALLTNGQVLVAGGTLTVEISGAPDRRIQTQTIKTSVLWNPATLGWTSTGDLQVSRTGQSMTTLLNGQVLVAGGESFDKGSGRLVPIASAELYTP